jgi:hypothetical protein
VRKVYDRRGRHWQNIAFLRHVPPDAVGSAAAAAGRPAVPCLGLMRAARADLEAAAADGCGGLTDTAVTGGKATEAGYARLAEATRRLFAPHAAAARAALAGFASCGRGGVDLAGQARAWFAEMERRASPPYAAPIEAHHPGPTPANAPPHHDPDHTPSNIGAAASPRPELPSPAKCPPEHACGSLSDASPRPVPADDYEPARPVGPQSLPPAAPGKRPEP